MGKSIRFCFLLLAVAWMWLSGARACCAQETAPRTVERAEDPCTISAEFRLELLNPKFPQKPIDTVLFAKAQPELQVLSNGKLGIQVKVIAVGPFPGELSFSFDRAAVKAGKPNPTAMGPFKGDNLAGLRAQLAQQDAVLVDPPPGVIAGAPIIENVKATVTWTPKDHPPCSLKEEVRVVWNFANPAAQVAWVTPTTPAGKSGVAMGRTIAPEGKKHTVPVQTFFSIKDVKKCCNKAGGYAVIQFVRHQVQIEETPRKLSTNNDWNLDILDSEAKRATDGEAYDPTFTQDPRGSNPKADPLVYPGPDGGGNSSIVQVDRPGIDTRLFDRLSKAGGSFTWQFHAFLICEIKPAGAPVYLAQGEVVEDLSYEIMVTFPGKGATPTVTGKPLAGPTAHSPCKLLKDLLDAMDKKATAGGKYIDAYSHPQPHTVVIPN